MVQFSWMQISVVVLLAAALAAVILWAVSRIARAVPPALEKPGYASGVSGVLLFVVLFMWLTAITPLFRLGREAAEVARVIMLDAQYWAAAVQTLIPDLVSAVLLTIASFMLTLGRTPRALYTAVVLGWLGGPASAFLRAEFLNIPLTLTGEPSAYVLAMVVVTLYLVFADRAALTYGLARAATLPERA